MVDNPIRQDTLEQEPGAMAYSGLDECYFRSTSSPCGHAIIGDPEQIHWWELPACRAGGATEVLESNLDRRHAMSTAIAIEGVTKRFGSVFAVDGLDLRAPQGSLYGFIGPNGSGKSTTPTHDPAHLAARSGRGRGPGPARYPGARPAGFVLANRVLPGGSISSNQLWTCAARRLIAS